LEHTTLNYHKIHPPIQQRAQTLDRLADNGLFVRIKAGID
jgi:hypothetical protein